ncbi:gp75 [Bacillus phage G]|uniref:Gp75 n=1 Tax=Bacillus phage G TaxID=2884420 RepID=G3MBE5_9CAUD|nr:gp75 [Bacillus phage G]AEO93346.1 gp75 [Bacillus phage G]
MKNITFSDELMELFKHSQFFKHEAKLVNLNSGKEVDIEPDEDGYVYIPEVTEFSPTSLVKNGDDEDAQHDYVFMVKLINEFRNQAK